MRYLFTISSTYTFTLVVYFPRLDDRIAFLFTIPINFFIDILNKLLKPKRKRK